MFSQQRILEIDRGILTRWIEEVEGEIEELQARLLSHKTQLERVEGQLEALERGAVSVDYQPL